MLPQQGKCLLKIHPKFQIIIIKFRADKTSFQWIRGWIMKDEKHWLVILFCCRPRDQYPAVMSGEISPSHPRSRCPHALHFHPDWSGWSSLNSAETQYHGIYFFYFFIFKKKKWASIIVDGQMLLADILAQLSEMPGKAKGNRCMVPYVSMHRECINTENVRRPSAADAFTFRALKIKGSTKWHKLQQMQL